MPKRVETKYPALVKAMKENNETNFSIAKMLGIGLTSIYRKLTGRNDWTISEIEMLCDYFHKDYYQLFK